MKRGASPPFHIRTLFKNGIPTFEFKTGVVIKADSANRHFAFNGFIYQRQAFIAKSCT